MLQIKYREEAEFGQGGLGWRRRSIDQRFEKKILEKGIEMQLGGKLKSTSERVSVHLSRDYPKRKDISASPRCCSEILCPKGASTADIGKDKVRNPSCMRPKSYQGPSPFG